MLDPVTPFDAPPHVIAHRGGALMPGNIGRENTLRAFRAAWDAGAHHLETDVHATSDGVLVALHDDHLDRVSDTSGAVAELPWSAVQSARVGGEPVPLLADLMDALPGATFTIDIKAPGAIALLATVLADPRRGRRACVGSFSERRLWSFRLRTRGRVATSAGRVGIAWLRYAPVGWRLLHSPAVAYQVPMTFAAGPLRLRVVTREFVRRAHDVGAQVHVWTIDDEATMEALLDLGVDGLVTDRPDLALAVLRRRGVGGSARSSSPGPTSRRRLRRR